MKLKIQLVIKSESDYHNIEFAESCFYYSANLHVDYFDFGGRDVHNEKYKNIIRRMNKYFVRKKYSYKDDPI
jgi:hypothetical protein